MNQTAPTLDTYIDKLVSERDWPELKKEDLDKIKSELRNKLEMFILLRLIGKLEDDEAKEAYEAIQSGDEEKIKSIAPIIKDKVKDTDEVVSQALLDFRKSYLGAA